MSDATPKRKIDHDNDRSFVRPRAWAKAKEAFNNQFHITELMVALEDDCCPRESLAIAIHMYLTASPQVQNEATWAYFDWTNRQCGDESAPLAPMPAAEQLPRSERVHRNTPDLVRVKELLSAAE